MSSLSSTIKIKVIYEPHQKQINLASLFSSLIVLLRPYFVNITAPDNIYGHPLRFLLSFLNLSKNKIMAPDFLYPVTIIKEH